MTFDDNGVVANTYEEILASVQVDYQAQWADIETGLSSSAGQLMRIQARREHQLQEKILQVYTQLDARFAEGVHADRAHANIGVTRLPDTPAEVVGTATGTATTVIPNGTRVSVGGFVFATTGGPHTIEAGGTVSDVRVVAEEPGAVDVSALGAWTIVDVVAGFDSFDDDTQPIGGRLVETTPEYRSRAEVARFSRSIGGLNAIEAAVSAVPGVTYVKAWHNVTVDPVDAEGIPLYAINVVVEGGDPAQVALAIWQSGPGGHVFYGTDESEVVVDGPAQHTIGFDRVTEIDMWAKATLVTSTSEEVAPDGLEALVKDLLVAYADANWTMGTDAISHRLEGALSTLSGVDSITVELSLDDGATDPYSTAKRAISIRERAVLTAPRVTVIES